MTLSLRHGESDDLVHPRFADVSAMTNGEASEVADLTGFRDTAFGEVVIVRDRLVLNGVVQVAIFTAQDSYRAETMP